MPKDTVRERTTLSKVAVLAGVSTSTVSLVLSGKGDQRRIPQETRDRVRQAAEDLNYAPNLLTRSLRRGRTNVLSFFTSFRHREWGDLYMDRVSSAVETAGGEFGYDILVHGNFRRSLKEMYQFLNGGMADGLLLFAPQPDDPLLEMLRRSPLPVVLVNGRDPLGQYSSARDEVEQGIELVVDAFLDAGHRRIAALGSVGADVRDSDDRIVRFRQSLERRGLGLPDGAVAWVEKDPRPGLEKILAGPEPPTALFCWHDWIAYRALEALESMGVDVPGELSIIGYDGLHWPSTSRHICTSIEVDLRAIAHAAVRLLDQSIADPSAESAHEIVPVRLRPGTTLAAPASLATEQP